MFELDPKLSALDAQPAAILEIHHSLNTAEVATKEFVGEPAKAYICLLTIAPQRLALFVSFFFPNKNRAIFYPYINNPFSPGRTEEVKDEAMLFLESFGFIMEQVVGKDSTAKDKDYWMARVPLFKLGAPAGEIILRSSALSFPADGTSQLIISSDLICDSKGEMVANGTKIRVGTNLGHLGTLEGEPSERQIIVSTTEGMITFLLKVPPKTGKATITAASEEGSAVGELTIDFLPLEPAGTIKLEAIPAKPYADGKTLVTIQSQPVRDTLGNVVVDGTLFSIEISDQERVLSSLQVTSKKGIIRHNLVAPSTPVTMLIMARSEKGQAEGELVITFEAPVPLIREELPPAALAQEEVVLPEVHPEPALVPESSVAGIFPGEAPLEMEPAPALEEEKLPVETVPAEVPISLLEEPAEGFTFKEEEVASAVEVVLDEAAVMPGPPLSAVKEEVEEEVALTAAEGELPPESLLELSIPPKVLPPVEVAEPVSALKGERLLEPLTEKPAEILSPEKLPPAGAISPWWEPYKELVRFLTRM